MGTPWKWRFGSIAFFVTMSVIFPQSSAFATPDPLAVLSTELAAATVQQKLPLDVQPSPSEWGTSQWTRDAFSLPNTFCFALRTDVQVPVQACHFGDLHSSKLLALFGDSQIYQWLPAFDLWGTQNGWQVVMLSKAGCHPWPSPTYTYDEHRSTGDTVIPYPQCPIFNAWAKRQLVKLKPTLTIVSGGIGTLSSLASEHAIGIEQGVATLVSSIAKTGSKVIMLGNTPWFIQDQPSPLCLSLHTTAVARCAISTSLLRSPTRPLMAEMSKAIDMIAKDNVVPIVRVMPLLCTTRRCPTVSASTVMYFDGTHISRQWAIHVVPALSELLQPFLGTT